MIKKGIWKLDRVSVGLFNQCESIGEYEMLLEAMDYASEDNKRFTYSELKENWKLLKDGNFYADWRSEEPVSATHTVKHGGYYRISEGMIDG